MGFDASRKSNGIGSRWKVAVEWSLLLVGSVSITNHPVQSIAMRRLIPFRQLRTGLHRDRFHVLKFKTMTDYSVNAAANNDRSVRSLGKLLGVSSLDEAPQLFNVMKGEMSLVGLGQDIVEPRNTSELRPRLTAGQSKAGYRAPVSNNML